MTFLSSSSPILDCKSPVFIIFDFSIANACCSFTFLLTCDRMLLFLFRFCIRFFSRAFSRFAAASSFAFCARFSRFFFSASVSGGLPRPRFGGVAKSYHLFISVSNPFLHRSSGNSSHNYDDFLLLLLECFLFLPLYSIRMCILYHPARIKFSTTLYNYLDDVLHTTSILLSHKLLILVLLTLCPYNKHLEKVSNIRALTLYVLPYPHLFIFVSILSSSVAINQIEQQLDNCRHQAHFSFSQTHRPSGLLVIFIGQ
nr:MAG TPA: hypothetical protein [Caudoviricetes sp.]